MRLLIKQRVFSWSDTYDVYDEMGDPKYYVRAKVFALGHHIHVYCKDTGEEVGAIHQRLLTILPKFDIEIGGQIVGTVSRELSLLRPRYTVDYKNWSVEGNLFAWDYTVSSMDRPIMRITRQWMNWGDTYSLEVLDPRHEIEGLMIVLAIDAANCED